MRFLPFRKTNVQHIWVRYSTLLLALTCSFAAFAQGNLKTAVAQLANEPALTKLDKENYLVADHYASPKATSEHIYLLQTVNGIEVHQALYAVHLDKAGKVLVTHNDFLNGAASRTKTATPTLSAIQAIESLATQMGYVITEELEVIQETGGPNKAVLVSSGGISNEKIPAKLVYFPTREGNLVLTWDFSIDERVGTTWWSFRVDAENGKLLDKISWTRNCSFGTCEKIHQHDTYPKEIPFSVEKKAAFVPNSYNVLPMPIESPNFGSRSIVTNPELLNTTASPDGWHDINGTTSQCTKGNNVDAYDDSNDTDTPSNGDADRACGGSALEFDFPFDPNSSNVAQYIDAAVTNLFYWNNTIHDMFYNYGFDEAAGNCQEHNFTSNGIASDGINAEAQDGSGTCNANMSTPPDGGNPRMQMYVCNGRDGDFDNGVIAHEYGHTISIRLTGGPSTSSCLNNSEQMGEGWSDYFGLIMSMDSSNTGPQARGIGTWLFGQGPNGAGIRPHPYSTSMTVNPHTYADISSVSVPHGVGSVWCAMLWEMTWGLIDEHGFDSDLYNGTGGNNIALNLVIEGLKLQPCNPGFVDGRDAILLADQNLYGGANQCIIWEAFAKRGLGFSATQGSTSSVSDGTEAFDLPNLCLIYDSYMEVDPDTLITCNTSSPTLGIAITSSGGFAEDVTLSLDNLPSGVSGTFSTNPVTAPGNSALTLSGLNGLADGNYTFDVLTASAGGVPDTVTVQLAVTSIAPPATTLAAPTDAAMAVNPMTTFSWNGVSNASSYDLEVATDAAFSTMVINETGLASTSFTVANILAAATTHYWRVRCVNDCGSSNYSPVFSFETDNIACISYASTDVPVSIPSSGTPTVISTLNITDAGGILDLNLRNLNITHSYVNDLTIRLKSPDGTEVNVLNRPCGSQNNIDIEFDDESTNAYGTFPCPPTDGLTYQPYESLDAFDTKDINGTWELVVSDAFNLDGGTIDAWSVEVCYTPGSAPVSVTTSATDVSCFGSTDGSVTATAAGGNNSSYTFLWDDPAASTTATISGLASGTYHVTVTDASSATATATATVGEPDAISSSSVISPETGNNMNGAINLTVTGGTSPYSFVWTAENDASFTSTDEDLTNLSADTYYVAITDDNACTASDTAVVDQTPYCVATSTNTNDEWISEVVIGAFTNTSGASAGYADFTNLIISAEQGDSMSVSITPEYSGTSWNEVFRIWIDYNQDFDFDDPDELVFDSGAPTNTTVTGSFTVPTTATMGQTRLRVIMRYNTTPDPCGTFTYGEVEDYTIDIEAPAPTCTPPTGISIYGVKDDEVRVGWTAVPNAIRYQVQHRPAATGGSWSSTFRNAAGPSFARIQQLTAATEYQHRLRTLCSTGWTDFTAVGVFTTDSCTTPSNFLIDRIKADRAFASWDSVPNIIRYQLRYREVGTSAWTTRFTTSNFRSITGLASSTTYEAYVRTQCSFGYTDYTALDTFTTLPAPIAPRGENGTASTASGYFELYPNPVHNMLNVEFDMVKTNEQSSIVVFDIIGKEVMRQELPIDFEGDRVEQLNIRHLQEGTYMIQFRNGERLMTRKFVKL